jgi:hypothetical protein
MDVEFFTQLAEYLHQFNAMDFVYFLALGGMVFVGLAIVGTVLRGVAAFVAIILAAVLAFLATFGGK